MSIPAGLCRTLSPYPASTGHRPFRAARGGSHATAIQGAGDRRSTTHGEPGSSLGGAASASAAITKMAAPAPSAPTAASGTWAATGTMNTARFKDTSTLLPDGEVLVAG